jgi:hypothetical protein
MWSVRLSDSQREAIRELLGEQEELTAAQQGAFDALDLARWDDLPEASLDWKSVEELATEQGIGEADVFWDLTSGMPGRRRYLRKAA